MHVRILFLWHLWTKFFAFLWARAYKTTNVPLNLTALFIIFSDRIFFSTRAIGPMNLDFFGLQMSLAPLLPFGAQKSLNSWAQSPSYWIKSVRKIMHGAVKFIGALIVNLSWKGRYTVSYSAYMQIVAVRDGEILLKNMGSLKNFLISLKTENQSCSNQKTPQRFPLSLNKLLEWFLL